MRLSAVFLLLLAMLALTPVSAVACTKLHPLAAVVMSGTPENDPPLQPDPNKKEKKDDKKKDAKKKDK